MVLLSDDVDKLDSESNILSNCMINSQSWFNIQVETYIPKMCNEYIMASHATYVGREQDKC